MSRSEPPGPTVPTRRPWPGRPVHDPGPHHGAPARGRRLRRALLALAPALFLLIPLPQPPSPSGGSQPALSPAGGISGSGTHTLRARHLAPGPRPAAGQEHAATFRPGDARSRWERLCRIRLDKFDLVLPEAMRENDIQMWIVVQREGSYDPLYEDLGRGYTGEIGYYIFTDRGGDRIERAAFGVSGGMLTGCPVYDVVEGSVDLRAFVVERDPERIGVNMSDAIGAADGLSHTEHRHLVETLGAPWADRLVSAEKLVSDFRSRRVASEIVAFGEAAELTRRIWERALSNEVITPGETALEDVAWWIWDRIRERGLDSAFDMPSVYITGPDGIVAISDGTIIQRGDVLMIDGGVCWLNLCPDVKRIAYVLREGETEVPEGIRRAFDRALEVRAVLEEHIRPGRTARETLDILEAEVEALDGFRMMEAFDQPYGGETTDVIIGAHSVGNLGHGVGPSIAFFNPTRLTYEIRPTNLFSIEFFAWTPVPEWGGAKLRIPYEDNAIVTERGLEWPYPPKDRVLVVR